MGRLTSFGIYLKAWRTDNISRKRRLVAHIFVDFVDKGFEKWQSSEDYHAIRGLKNEDFPRKISSFLLEYFEND